MCIYSLFYLSCFIEKCQLETLGLSGNKVREDEVESELIKFMANNKRLQTLILNYSRLRCQFGKQLLTVRIYD